MKFFHKLADLASYWLGTPQSMLAHALWWLIWFTLPVEPNPYSLLTLIVSLEAIIMCILLLNSDARQGERDRKAVKKDLDVDVETNKTVNKIWEHLKNDRL